MESIKKTCLICKSDQISFFCKALLSKNSERDVYSCNQCKSKFYWPNPSLDELSLCYEDSYFDDYVKTKWGNYYRGKFIAQRLQAWRQNGTLLEVGCASGAIILGIKDHSNWKIHGVETSKFASQYAREQYGLDVKTGVLEEQDYAPGSFDFILINNVLEHVPNPDDFLTHVSSLLKKGGRILLSVPNGLNDISPNKILWERKGLAVPTRHTGHIFFFSRESLNLIFKNAGLNVVKWNNLHFQTALKNEGKWPGYLEKFSKRNFNPAKKTSEIPSETKPYPEIYYRYRQFCKSLWKFSFTNYGADYEILLEKK